MYMGANATAIGCYYHCKVYIDFNVHLGDTSVRASGFEEYTILCGY